MNRFWCELFADWLERNNMDYLFRPLGQNDRQKHVKTLPSRLPSELLSLAHDDLLIVGLNKVIVNSVPIYMVQLNSPREEFGGQ